MNLLERFCSGLLSKIMLGYYLLDRKKLSLGSCQEMSWCPGNWLAAFSGAAELQHKQVTLAPGSGEDCHKKPPTSQEISRTIRGAHQNQEVETSSFSSVLSVPSIDKASHYSGCHRRTIHKVPLPYHRAGKKGNFGAERQYISTTGIVTWEGESLLEISASFVFSSPGKKGCVYTKIIRVCFCLPVSPKRFLRNCL